MTKMWQEVVMASFKELFSIFLQRDRKMTVHLSVQLVSELKFKPNME
jgi:hypothetical protein